MMFLAREALRRGLRVEPVEYVRDRYDGLIARHLADGRPHSGGTAVVHPRDERIVTESLAFGGGEVSHPNDRGHLHCLHPPLELLELCAQRLR